MLNETLNYACIFTGTIMRVCEVRVLIRSSIRATGTEVQNKVEVTFLPLGPELTRNLPNRISIFFFNFMKNSRKIELSFLSRNGAVRSRKYKNSKNAKGSTNTRGQRPRRAMARVLPGAPRLAADSFGRQRLGGYGSRCLLGGLAPPRRPTRAAATGI